MNAINLELKYSSTMARSCLKFKPHSSLKIGRNNIGQESEDSASASGSEPGGNLEKAICYYGL